MAKRMLHIFSNQFWEEQYRSFCYKPDPKYKKLVGVVSSADTAVSLALQDGTASKLVNFVSFRSPAMFDSAPSKRMVSVDEPFDSCVISGVVFNTKKTHVPAGDRIINIYLIVEDDA